MNRCVIFVIYDEEGVVDECIFDLIEQFREIANDIIIVCNLEIKDKYIKELSRKVYKVVKRENKGYDAGAYRDILIGELGSDRMKQYDEIILSNDSYFGFFKPLTEIFEKMQLKECDFWAIGKMNYGMFSYLQSYFLVFRSRIIQSDDLHLFFKKVLPINIANRAEASVYFELGIYQYLISKAYVASAYVEAPKYYMFGSSNDTLKYDGYPLLKKKAFDSQFYNQTRMAEAVSWIKENTNYSVENILTAVKRKYHIQSLCLGGDILKSCQLIKPIILGTCVETKESILKFMQLYEKVYFYGCGIFMMYLLYLIEEEDNNLHGIIVSEGRRESLKTNPDIKGLLVEKGGGLFFKQYPIYEIQEMMKDEKAAIVVTLDYKNSKMIKQDLENNTVMHGDILYLWEGM